MKFTCTRENLSHALDGVSGVANRQSHLPILSNIFIEATASRVALIATDLEIAIHMTVRAKIEQEGSFTVPAKTITDFVRLLLEEQVVLELRDNELHLTCGNSSTKIKGTSAEEFPVIPHIEEGTEYQINASLYRDALAKTIVAVAKNEIRPELSGICFRFFSPSYDGFLLAATDSYRLAEKRAVVSQGTNAVNCIVPAKTASEMIRLLLVLKEDGGEQDIHLFVSANQIALRFEQCEMVSRLIDGAYPDYEQIIPASFKTTATFPADVFIKRIKAASLFTTTGVNAVAFDLNVEEKTVGISSTSTQTGEHTSEIDADVRGEENSILLNHKYVIDGVQHMGDGDVEFCVNSAESPCLFRPKSSHDYVYIVMPIRQ